MERMGGHIFNCQFLLSYRGERQMTIEDVTPQDSSIYTVMCFKYEYRIHSSQ
jgi:hypothetical protein